MTNSPNIPVSDIPLRKAAARRGVRIGTALDHEMLKRPSPYQSVAAVQFNSVTVENALKWDHTEPAEGTFTWERADRIMAFADAHHQRVRGHPLLWHEHNPAWVTAGGLSTNRLRSAVRERIAVTVGRYAGRIECWDVVNEPLHTDGSYRETPWREVLGPDYIAEALHCARLADPAAKLYINEFDTDGFRPKSDALYVLARQLLEDGVPLDGIGFQTHLLLGRIPPDLGANLQRFADLGLDVAVTELDIRMELPATEDRLTQQAEEYEAVVRACLGVTRCREIILWGFTDTVSWIPKMYPGYGAATLFDGGYLPKPAYHAVVRALDETAAAPQGAGEYPPRRS